jgi:4-nitrophenyl phosphatase
MIKAVIFDLDGTVYLGNTLVPGAVEKVEELRKKGITVIFFTNAGTRSRKGVAMKLEGMGMRTEPGRIYCGAYLLARYIEEKHKGMKAFVIGERGILEECEELGVPLTESGADIVAVGLDRAFDYRKLAKALAELGGGAILLASNKDATYPTESGPMPGAGSLVAAVEFASGKPAEVVGKPNKYSLKLIEKEHSLKPGEIIIVGDRLDTDIKYAKECGIRSALVLTGASKKSDIKDIKPDFIFPSVAEFELPKE